MLNERSLYWKPLFLQNHEEDIACYHSINIGMEKACGKVLQDWLVEEDRKAEARYGWQTYFRFKRSVQSQHENPLQSYESIWRERDRQRFQKEDPEGYEAWMRDLDEHLDSMDQSKWTDEIWDRKEQEILNDQRDTARYYWKIAKEMLAQFYLYPFSWRFRGLAKGYLKDYLDWRRRLPELKAIDEMLLAQTRKRREFYKQQAVEYAEAKILYDLRKAAEQGEVSGYSLNN